MKKYTLHGETKMFNAVIAYCGTNVIYNELEECVKGIDLKNNMFQYVIETDECGKSVRIPMHEAVRISKLKQL